MPPFDDPAISSAQSKKPRHRHSPNQLAALNHLFDQNEHPPLEQRSALADRLGMETKTVNAWFQNKRASSKKRVRGSTVQYDSQTLNTAPPPPSPNSLPLLTNNEIRHLNDIDDMHDDDNASLGLLHSRSASVVPSDYPPSFHLPLSDQGHSYPDTDTVPRRMRTRPSAEQSDELKKLYNINPHPSTEQRQALSARIGMPYSSITNWFQNQRSMAKKRKEDDLESYSFAAPKAEYRHESRQYSAFPPPTHSHPSLSLPPLPMAAAHPSLIMKANDRDLPRSRSISPPFGEPSPSHLPWNYFSRGLGPSDYGRSSPSFARPRRSRPEPYQLDALKDLFHKTSTPTIEERSALALEIGMDVGKVTNWFRNLRQTARKRTKKSGSGDEDDDFDIAARNAYNASLSRVGTPSFGSSSSSSMNGDGEDSYMQHAPSDNGSEEDDYQEAVTPSPEHSPSPPRSSGVHPHDRERDRDRDRPRKEYRSLETLTMPYPVMTGKVSPSGINYDDAMLLISFHHGICGRDLPPY